MNNYFFVSDLHGKTERYEKLFNTILNEKPIAVLLGGDLLPHSNINANFIDEFLTVRLTSLKEKLNNFYPKVFLILGNDDARSEEHAIITAEQKKLFEYLHMRSAEFCGRKIFGYSFTPPSPFLLKDWEKYDLSRYTEFGSISPEEGKRTVEIPIDEIKYSTIKDDLELLTGSENLSEDIILFHGPPYKTNLDRAALDGKMIDHTQVDLHVGSIAIRKFIEKREPKITLHGHIHESARITGSWKDRIGKTFCLSAAHDGKELAVVKFNPTKPEEAERVLI
ncbi:MAG: metallophosphoesterase [Ignavibacteriales bacterium]|nr:metallophosphoesterase [Ignavibacteriales bacterium]